MDKLGKTRRDHLKERLTINKIAKFENDLLKINEDTAPQSREILQTYPETGSSVKGIASVTHPLGKELQPLNSFKTVKC